MPGTVSRLKEATLLDTRRGMVATAGMASVIGAFNLAVGPYIWLGLLSGAFLALTVLIALAAGSR